MLVLVMGVGMGLVLGAVAMSFADDNPATSTITDGNLILPYDG